MKMKIDREKKTITLELPLSPELASTGRSVHLYSSHGWATPSGDECSFHGVVPSVSVNVTLALKKLPAEAANELRRSL